MSFARLPQSAVCRLPHCRTIWRCFCATDCRRHAAAKHVICMSLTRQWATQLFSLFPLSFCLFVFLVGFLFLYYLHFVALLFRLYFTLVCALFCTFAALLVRSTACGTLQMKWSVAMTPVRYARATTRAYKLLQPNVCYQTSIYVCTYAAYVSMRVLYIHMALPCFLARTKWKRANLLARNSELLVCVCLHLHS